MSKQFIRRMSSLGRELERSMKTNSPILKRFGIPIGVILLVTIFVIQTVAGEVAAMYFAKVWDSVRVFLYWVFQWDNLATTAIVILVLWIGGLVGHAYYTTMPPKDILFRPIEPTHAGEGAWSGFFVENRTGEDLDRVWIAHKDSKLPLQWGRSDSGSEYHDLPHGKEKPMVWLYFDNSTKHTTVRKTSSSPVLPIGKYEVELEVGLTPKGKALYTKPLYVTVEITNEYAKVIKTEW